MKTIFIFALMLTASSAIASGVAANKDILLVGNQTLVGDTRTEINGEHTTVRCYFAHPNSAGKTIRKDERLNFVGTGGIRNLPLPSIEEAIADLRETIYPFPSYLRNAKTLEQLARELARHNNDPGITVATLHFWKVEHQYPVQLVGTNEIYAFRCRSNQSFGSEIGESIILHSELFRFAN